jgi:hypothetical protein
LAQFTTDLQLYWTGSGVLQKKRPTKAVAETNEVICVGVKRSLLSTIAKMPRIQKKKTKPLSESRVSSKSPGVGAQTTVSFMTGVCAATSPRPPLTPCIGPAIEYPERELRSPLEYAPGPDKNAEPTPTAVDTSAGNDLATLLDTRTDWNSSPILDVIDTTSATPFTNDPIFSEDDGIDNGIDNGDFTGP